MNECLGIPNSLVTALRLQKAKSFEAAADEDEGFGGSSGIISPLLKGPDVFFTNTKDKKLYHSKLWQLAVRISVIIHIVHFSACVLKSETSVLS